MTLPFMLASMSFYVVSFLVLMGLLVSVHEFGHYYAARTIGIEASHFSLGFGPVLYARKDRRGCAWQVCLYPVGGFVKFKGDLDAASTTIQPSLAARSSALSEEQRRPYLSMRTPTDRAFVVAAGPILNLVFGFGLIGAVFVGYGRSVTSPVVRHVVAGEPAALAGMRDGDRLLLVDGASIARFEDATGRIAGHVDTPVDIVVSRDEGGASRRMAFRVMPLVASQAVFGVARQVGRIGIVAGERRLLRATPLEAIREGFAEVVAITKGVGTAMVEIVTGQRGVKDMGGPVRIAEMSGNAAMAGALPFVVLLAVMSINIGLFNLFPIPVLDGGHLVVCLIEIATGRPVRERTMQWVNSLGFAFLACVCVTVTFSDLRGLLD